MSVKRFDTELIDGQWFLVRRTPLAGSGLPVKSLTNAEERVLELLCEMKQNKEIASALGISVGGVKFHVMNLLRKFGCESRAELLYKSQRS